MLDGMKFALGPTIAARRATLLGIGGFDAVKDFLAEDFVMGNLAAARGDGVILSSYVIEHHIGAQTLGANLRHRLRWNRSTRRSRPSGYVGQLFTNPLPLALLLWAARPEWWPAAPPPFYYAPPPHGPPPATCCAIHSPRAASSRARAGHAQLRHVAGRFLRQYHSVARPAVLPPARRKVRIGPVLGSR